MTIKSNLQEWSPSHYSTKLRKKHAPKAEAVPDAPGSGGAVLESSSQTEQKTVIILFKYIVPPT